MERNKFIQSVFVVADVNHCVFEGNDCRNSVTCYQWMQLHSRIYGKRVRI